MNRLINNLYEIGRIGISTETGFEVARRIYPIFLESTRNVGGYAKVFGCKAGEIFAEQWGGCISAGEGALLASVMVGFMPVAVVTYLGITGIESAVKYRHKLNELKRKLKDFLYK